MKLSQLINILSNELKTTGNKDVKIELNERFLYDVITAHQDQEYIHIIINDNSVIDLLKNEEENKPTNIGYYKNGNVQYKEWYVNGKRHNENGLAVIEYYENGNIKHKSWWINNKYHNENGPAYIEYCENGNIQYKSWWINGKRHNKNGPAIIEYDQNGNITEQQYWKNGIRIK